MDQHRLDEFKTILETKKGVLETHIRDLERTPDMGDDVDSLEEETNETQELGNQMSVSQEYREQLAEVDSALYKIARGEYGTCEQCGRDIEMAILTIDPESRLCRECKHKKVTPTA